MPWDIFKYEWRNTFEEKNKVDNSLKQAISDSFSTKEKKIECLEMVLNYFKKSMYIKENYVKNKVKNMYSPPPFHSDSENVLTSPRIYCSSAIYRRQKSILC